MADLRTSSMGGVPKGTTSDRPSSPSTGDVFYNGTLEILEIWNGTGWVAVSAPPATPSLGTPTDASSADAWTSTAGKITAVFTPGSGGGTPSQYNLFTSSGGFSANSSSTTVTLTGLTPGTGYTVYGNAQNNFGTTVNTGTSGTVTPTTKPQAPTIGTATASSSANEITVTWTLGATGGKSLSSITITPYLNGTTAGTPRTASTTSSTSYTFTEGQLTSNSSYTFKVKTTNANGDSPESSASSSATMPAYITMDFLVVAGGGGGGNDYYSAGRASGGGGAGGLRCSVQATGGGGTVESALTLSLGTNYAITVGAGGAGMATGGAQQASNGSASSIGSVISTVGGGGGGGHDTGNNWVGRDGGSGGAGGNNTTNSLGTANQGYNSGVSGTPGAGGGGAGAVGASTGSSSNGNGGIGIQTNISGTSTYYAGGGGGGGSDAWSGSKGSGGNGGGGNGSGGVGGDGTANTGGGAGGGRNTGGRGGGNGGSGIVILKYIDTRTITIGSGLTGSTSSPSGGYKVTTITAGTGNVSWA